LEEQGRVSGAICRELCSFGVHLAEHRDAFETHEDIHILLLSVFGLRKATILLARI